MNHEYLLALAKTIRYNILISTTAAGSGHPSSSLSGVELMATLMFGGYFRADLNNPKNPTNDRLIFSKGHAAPLLYSLYAVAGKVSTEELKSLRQFDSKLEGHPTLRFPYTEAATGSLGQGLGIGAGMALAARMDNLDYRTFVLLGDSEMAEGSVWEAMELAAYNQLDNLWGIIDVNRLGQRGETMDGHNVDRYKAKAEAFGWETVIVDGHNIPEIQKAYDQLLQNRNGKPKMIVAKTFKGHGISLLQDKEQWHGKPLDNAQLEVALDELGPVDTSITGTVEPPQQKPAKTAPKSTVPTKGGYQVGEKVATRKAYGKALAKIGAFSDVVALDAETSNSTFADEFAKQYPERFVECFIAEQNMISMGLGLARRGKVPFCSTFGAFLGRAYDQIRMIQYSEGNVKIVGSHAGVSIGEDGSSQMALEDLAIFRPILNSVVLYPSDGNSTLKLVEQMYQHQGLAYLRTTRAETPVLYGENEEFPIGKSKTLVSSDQDSVTLISAGITLFQALEAAKKLQDSGILVRVIDLYSVKPIDKETLLKAVEETQAIITIEDHYIEGGIFGAVCEALATEKITNSEWRGIHPLVVQKMSCSGTMAELLRHEEIDTQAIVEKVNQIL